MSDPDHRPQAGQLGYGTKKRSGWEPAQEEPKDVPGLSGVNSLAAGDRHMCALLESGGVSCWGANSDGQLDDAVQIGGAFGLTCAVKKSNGIVCWGRGGGFESVLRVPTDVE